MSEHHEEWRRMTKDTSHQLIQFLVLHFTTVSEHQRQRERERNREIGLKSDEDLVLVYL